MNEANYSHRSIRVLNDRQHHNHLAARIIVLGHIFADYEIDAIILHALLAILCRCTFDDVLKHITISQFINELRQRYDMVFIDSAPVAMVSDSLSLVGHADAVVYVTRANYTKRSLVKYANDLVARGQLRNVAMVINDTTPSL